MRLEEERGRTTHITRGHRRPIPQLRDRRRVAIEAREQNGIAWCVEIDARPEGRAGRATIHRHSAGPLTLGSLAASVGMSRSAFAKRFTTLVGEPAMRYVLRWKMQTAVNLLKDKQLAVGEVAHRLGFDSESAFSRAFKRIIGKSPGSARREDAPVR